MKKFLLWVTLAVIFFICSIDTNIVTQILFVYIPIIFIIWKKYFHNIIKSTVVSDLANIAQVIIALCAVFPLLPYTNNARTEGYYILSKDDKILIFMRATFKLGNNNIVLDPLFTAKISLLIATKQTFYVNEISSSILEHYHVLKPRIFTEIPKVELSQNNNFISISLISAEIFRRLVEEGLKKRWYLILLSKIPGTQIVITICDTYDQKHLIYPTKNTMRAIYRGSAIIK